MPSWPVIIVLCQLKDSATQLFLGKGTMGPKYPNYLVRLTGCIGNKCFTILPIMWQIRLEGPMSIATFSFMSRLSSTRISSDRVYMSTFSYIPLLVTWVKFTLEPQKRYLLSPV